MQAVAVGSVIQEDIDSTSLLRVVAALYVPVHAEAVGSVMQPLRAVTSVLRVDTEAVIPGMEDVPL